MLDIKVIRQDPQRVKEAMRNRQNPMDETIDEILNIDEQRRVLTAKTEGEKAEQNKLSKQIPLLKKEGKNTEELMAQLKTLSDDIKEMASELSGLETKQRELLLRVPNIPHESVPVGKDDSDNVEQRRWGEPRTFDFEPKAHWDLGTGLDILDFERAAKVAGARFTFYKGLGARLERSVINFYMDFHAQHG